jgi:hypothetical protein
LIAALDGFSYALTEGSPCLGTGYEGADMGAAHGVLPGEPVSSSIINIGPGRYPGRRTFVLNHGESLQGAGEGQTVIEGTLWGLKTDRFAADLTVTAGRRGGVCVGIAQSPTFRGMTITGNKADRYGGGAYLDQQASPTFTACTITHNAAPEGGGVYHWGGAAEFTDCIIAGNAAGVGVGSTAATRRLRA